MGIRAGRPLDETERKFEVVPKHMKYILPQKTVELTDRDYEFLTQATGKNADEIKEIFRLFNLHKSDVKVDKKTFILIFQTLHEESQEYVHDVTEHVFAAFDQYGSGYISFNEFFIAYSLTNRCEMRPKLDYAFDLYDIRSTGVLNWEEVRSIVTGKFKLLIIGEQIERKYSI